MKERPILFSGPMVRAIREGCKTQTRRVIKPQPLLMGSMWSWITPDGRSSYIFPNQTGFPVHCTEGMHTRSPYGQPGDRLWVRETWQHCEHCGGVDYAADVNRPRNCRHCDATLGNWKPSIHMFREDSRITLEIVRVRAEQLQDISNEDCWNEGMCDATNPELKANRRWFSELWESINGPGSWDLNQWVWVVEFKEVKP